MNKATVVKEWLNKESDFDFESTNEDKHNVEDFTKENTKQNSWITYYCNEVNKNNIPNDSDDAAEGDIYETDNRQHEVHDFDNKLKRTEHWIKAKEKKRYAQWGDRQPLGQVPRECMQHLWEWVRLRWSISNLWGHLGEGQQCPREGKWQGRSRRSWHPRRC